MLTNIVRRSSGTVFRVFIESSVMSSLAHNAQGRLENIAALLSEV